MESFSAEINSTDLYPQSTPTVRPQEILSMVILGLTFLLGLPGNGLVLWIAGLKMRRTVNTIWFLHLTLADFLCCLSLPFSLAHLILRGHWPYGLFLCKLIPSIIILNMFASVFLLTAISLDRCLMVYKPIWCQNHRNLRTALIICGCIWVVAFIMSAPVFIYRQTFVRDDHEICSYNFGPSSSLDYMDMYNLSLLENDSLENSIAQLPGHMDDSLDPSSFQATDNPWTVTSALHSQTFQRSSGGSVSLDSARLSSQHPHHHVLKPANVLISTKPSEFPAEDHRTHTYDNTDDFLSTDLELFPELSQDFLDYNLEQFTYDSQVPTPLVAMAITRLVIGFLLPLLIMVACYSLIVFRIRKSNFTRSRSKTLRVAVVVVTVFLVCWTPYHIIGVLILFINPETSLGNTLLSWDHIAIALASANSCFNPFLYALMGKDFRKKARQSMKGILEAAFSEELTYSTNCTQDRFSSKRNDISTDV